MRAGECSVMSFLKKHKKISFLLIVLGLLLLLLLAALLFVKAKLDKIRYDDGRFAGQGQELETVRETECETETEPVEENIISEEELAGLEEKQSTLSDMEIFSDSDVFNILLLGTDERKKEFSANARSDSMMILSIDKEHKTVKLVSLERGMGVPILEGQYKGQYDWLTHCFRYGGAQLVLKEVQECLRVDVERYVRVNFNTFTQLIDSVGGVDIPLTAQEAQGLNGQKSTKNGKDVDVQEGINHLDGHNALRYARLRYIDSDWKRVQRQRTVIQNVTKQLKEMNLLEMNKALDEVLLLVQTNLTQREILELAAFAPHVLGTDIEQMTIPVKGTYGGMKGMGGRSLYAVDFEKNAQILKEFLYAE